MDTPRLNKAAASAPGSLMLLGEHAVLHGRRALVCAINQRMTVRAQVLSEPVLQIDSALGSYLEPLDRLADHPHFRFVLDAVRRAQPSYGISLQIQSDFPSDIGFGSSSSVTVAVSAALMRLCGEAGQELSDPAREALFSRSLDTVRRVQGRGSGADVAASVFGGIIAYRARPLEIQTLPNPLALTAVYSGSKMKTVEVIRHLEEQRSANPDLFERIFDRIDHSVGGVIADFSKLEETLRLNQVLMEKMGLCNEALADIIRSFEETGVAAKISGSGLGDCAVGLGKFPAPDRYRVFPLLVDPRGACLLPDEAVSPPESSRE